MNRRTFLGVVAAAPVLSHAAPVESFAGITRTIYTAPVTLLPAVPSLRLALIRMWVDAGIITTTDACRLLDLPDPEWKE